MYDQRSNVRYIGAANRNTLPELQNALYDVSLDDREDDDIILRPVYFAVVDVTGSADVVEEFRSALLTALGQLSEEQHFALALLDESAMYVMNWNANRFHTVRCTDDEALRKMSDRIALRDVVGRIGTVKKAAELLISQLEAKPVKQGDETAHNSYFGEALHSLLSFLLKASRDGVSHLDADGRLLGSRIAAFLCKVPSKGSGRVLSPDHRVAEQDRGYYQDPLNPEFAMANLSIREAGSAGGAGDSQPTTPCVPPLMRSGILDEVAQEFYSGAGAAAAVAGLAIDIYTVGTGANVAGAENLAVVTSLSGGDFTVYDVDNGEVTLAEDLHDALQLDELLDCSIRIRTSTELRVLGNMDSRLQQDSEQCDLYHAPRLRNDVTCGGILLDICDSGLGLSNRPPAYVQAAVRFHRIDNDNVLRRYLRVLTCEFPLAKTVGEVLLRHNVDAHLFVEFCGAMALVGLSGRDDAASALDDRLEQYICKRQAWIEEGDYMEDGHQADRREQLGPDVFGMGMRRMVEILDGGGRVGDFERMERLYYGWQRGCGRLMDDVLFPPCRTGQ